jgi:hypothetical protein
MKYLFPIVFFSCLASITIVSVERIKADYPQPTAIGLLQIDPSAHLCLPFRINALLRPTQDLRLRRDHAQICGL